MVQKYISSFDFFAVLLVCLQTILTVKFFIICYHYLLLVCCCIFMYVGYDPWQYRNMYIIIIIIILVSIIVLFMYKVLFVIN